MMPHAKDANLVRVNIFLTEEERNAFDMKCRYGGTRMSMTAAARELFRLYVAGKVEIDRKGANARARNVGRPPAATPKRRTPRPKMG